jgi:hypothetical protein
VPISLKMFQLSQNYSPKITSKAGAKKLPHNLFFFISRKFDNHITGKLISCNHGSWQCGDFDCYKSGTSEKMPIICVSKNY